jgi:ABC-type glycerol-3-phosphate transport system substrate-binding protein
MKKGFKKGLALTLASVMLLSTTACGGSSTPSSSAAQGGSTSSGAASEELTGELRVTTQAWMMGKYDFEGIKADFEKKHPGVTVVYNKVDNADVTTNMLQWSQGKTNCDIAIGGSQP